MADITIADVRKKYPQYNDLSDAQLADSLHSKFYSDMPRVDFDKKIGVGRQEIVDEATRRQGSNIPGEAIDLTQATVGNTITFGAYPQIMAAGRAGARALARPFTHSEGNFVDDYARERDVMREQINQRRARAGFATTLPLDIAGGLAATPGRVAAAAADVAVPTMRELMTRSAKWGAGFGALQSFNENTGDWTDKLKDAGAGAVGGAVVGGIIPPALVGMGKIAGAVRRPFERARSGPGGEDRVATQRGVVADWEELVPDARIPPAIVTESPALQAATRRTGSTMVGGRVQDDLERGAEALTGRVRARITGDDLPDAGEFAREQQGFLRHNLQQHSRTGDELDNLSPAELSAVAGRNPSETYPTQYGARYRQAEQSPVEGYGTAANIRANFVDRFPPARALTPQSRNTVGEALRRSQQARQANKPPSPYSPEEIDAIADQWQYAKGILRAQKPENLTEFVIRSGRLRDDQGEVTHLMGGLKGRPGLVARNGQTLDDMTMRAWASGYFPDHKQRPTINDFLSRLQDDLQGRPVFRAGDAQHLEDVRVATEMANELAEMGIWNARNPQTLRARLGDPRLPSAGPAAETTNPISSPTATWNVLNEFGRDARRAGQLKGWKDGDFTDEFWANLEGRLGKPITDTLRSEAQRRASNQANLRIPGLRDQRTMVGRAIDEAQQPIVLGESAPRLNLADLKRLYGAQSEDLQRFMNTAGPGGPAAARNYAAVDQDYGQDFIAGLREPLRKIFGRNVNPDQALRKLMAATQKNTYDGNLLRAYQRVLLDKSSSVDDVQRATRMLVTPMAEGGLPGFLKAWDQMHPSARMILSAGDRSLFRELDRYVKLAKRFQPYDKLLGADRGAAKMMNATNIGMGVWALTHLPTAIFAAAGVNGLARFFSSPRYLKWLTTAPKHGVRGHGTTSVVDALTRLQAIAGQDDEIGETVLRAMQPILEGMRPSSARAALNQETGLENREPLIPPTNVIPDDDTRDEEHDRNIYIDNPTARKSTTQREVEAGQFINKGALERFLEPARGIAGTVQRTIDETPQQFDRLTNYRTGQNDPQAPLDALALSGLAATGGLATGATRSTSQLGTFIGRAGAENLAKAGRPTAQRILEGAAQLEREGVSVERIQAASRRMIEQQDPRLGTVDKGPDGQWRVEIDDSLASFHDTRSVQGRPLREAMDHDEFFTAYPDAGDITVRNAYGSGAKITKSNPDTPSHIELGAVDDPRGVMLHELQHEVQYREGFARGGSPSEFIAQRGGDDVTARGDYRRLAGEVEAERVRNRADLSPAERRQTPMRMTAPNIPDTQQIVRQHGRGAAVSEMAPRKPAPERVQQAIEMRERGVSQGEVAAELGISREGLRLWLKEAGRNDLIHGRMHVDPKAKRAVAMLEAGRKVKDVTAELGMSRQTLASWRHRMGRQELIKKQAPNIGAGEVEIIRRLHRQGVSNKNIAFKINRDPTTVSKFLRDVGLEANRPRGMKLGRGKTVRWEEWMSKDVLEARGIPLPSQRNDASMWEQGGSLDRGDYGYWGSNEGGDIYDDRIVGDHSKLPNPKGGRMRHLHPRKEWAEWPPRDTRGRFGLHTQPRKRDRRH